MEWVLLAATVAHVGLPQLQKWCSLDEREPLSAQPEVQAMLFLIAILEVKVIAMLNIMR